MSLLGVFSLNQTTAWHQVIPNTDSGPGRPSDKPTSHLWHGLVCLPLCFCIPSTFPPLPHVFPPSLHLPLCPSSALKNLIRPAGETPGEQLAPGTDIAPAEALSLSEPPAWAWEAGIGGRRKFKTPHPSPPSESPAPGPEKLRAHCAWADPSAVG